MKNRISNNFPDGPTLQRIDSATAGSRVQKSTTSCHRGNMVDLYTLGAKADTTHCYEWAGKSLAMYGFNANSRQAKTRLSFAMEQFFGWRKQLVKGIDTRGEHVLWASITEVKDVFIHWGIKRAFIKDLDQRGMNQAIEIKTNEHKATSSKLHWRAFQWSWGWDYPTNSLFI